MTAQPIRASAETLEERAWEIYWRLRPQIETPENIGKLIVMDVESGDYEIDDMGIETSLRLQARHPGVTLFAIRIGYKTADSFCGDLELVAQFRDGGLLTLDTL